MAKACRRMRVQPKCGSSDLHPIRRTRHFPKKSINPENDGNENKQIQRRADNWFPPAGSGCLVLLCHKFNFRLTHLQ